MPPADSGPEEGRPPARRQGRPPVPSTISQEELERVIRRASELQFRSSTAPGGSIESQDVIQIGAEVGLDERHVRQALAEVQATSLLPEAPEDSGLARRLFGPAIIIASRVVPGRPADIEANLESHLSEKELLQRVRTRPGRTLWEPAAGLVPQMRRNMDFTGRGYILAKARSLQVVTEPLEDGWALVTLTADMRNRRAEFAGWSLTMLPLGGIGGAVGITLATGGGLLPILGGVVLASGCVGLGASIARGGTTQIRTRMELALQGLLDRLERGEDLVRAREPWHHRLPW